LVEQVGGRGEAHRGAGMAVAPVLHRVHGEGANGVDGALVEFGPLQGSAHAVRSSRRPVSWVLAGCVHLAVLAWRVPAWRRPPGGCSPAASTGVSWPPSSMAAMASVPVMWERRAAGRRCPCRPEARMPRRASIRRTASADWSLLQANGAPAGSVGCLSAGGTTRPAVLDGARGVG